MQAKGILNESFDDGSNSNLDTETASDDVPSRCRLLKVHFKPGISGVHFSAIVMLYIAAGTLLLVQTTFLVYALRHEDYYDVPKDTIGSTAGDVVFYSELGVVCGIGLALGVLMDVVGPRIIIDGSLLISSAATASVPYGTSPLPFLVFMRLAILVGLIMSLANPLCIDYVTHESQGIANGWLYITLVLSIMLTNLVFFEVA